MAKNENTKNVSARESLLSLAKEKFPDRKFAENGEPAGEGISDLDEAIKELVDNLTARQAEYDEKNSKLADLLMSDPKSAEYLQKWVETGDPRSAFIDLYGDDFGISEEGREKYKANLAAWREKKAANDAIEAEAEANWNASLEALDAWGDAKGLSLEQKRDVMARLLAITFNGMENKYSADDFDIALNSINHDTDVESAHREGVIEGRNAKIAAARRDRNVSSVMPPSSVGRQGGSMPNPKPVKKSFWGEVNNG